jgi:hypothetical protein
MLPAVNAPDLRKNIAQLKMVVEPTQLLVNAHTVQE